MPANLENSAVATGLEQVCFHSNPKECSNYCTTVLNSHTSKVMLKILQARLKQHVNQARHGPQHARLPCLSLSLRVCSNSRPLSLQCHPTISYSVALLLSTVFPQHQSFPMSQLVAWAGQSIGALASASVLSVNIQRWFPLGLTGLISMLSKGLSSGPQF